jgi:hypothetical protein
LVQQAPRVSPRLPIVLLNKGREHLGPWFLLSFSLVYILVKKPQGPCEIFDSIYCLTNFFLFFPLQICTSFPVYFQGFCVFLYFCRPSEASTRHFAVPGSRGLGRSRIRIRDCYFFISICLLFKFPFESSGIFQNTDRYLLSSQIIKWMLAQLAV